MLLLFIRLLYYDEDKISVNFFLHHAIPQFEVNQLLPGPLPPKAKASVDELPAPARSCLAVFILFPMDQLVPFQICILSDGTLGFVLQNYSSSIT